MGSIGVVDESVFLVEVPNRVWDRAPGSIEFPVKDPEGVTLRRSIR